MNKKEQIETAVEIIIGGSEKGNRLLLTEGNYSKASWFEGLIYNGLKVLDILKVKIPNEYPLIEDQFKKELFSKAMTEGYVEDMTSNMTYKEGFIQFINNRSDQYSIKINTEDEFKQMLSTLAHNIYEYPFNQIYVRSKNLPLIMEISMRIEHILNFHKDCASVIIQSCNFT